MQCKIIKPKKNLPIIYQSPSHPDSKVMPYETPVQYTKQIRQCTFDVSHMLKSKSGFKYAVIGRMIKMHDERNNA